MNTSSGYVINGNFYDREEMIINACMMLVGVIFVICIVLLLLSPICLKYTVEFDIRATDNQASRVLGRAG